MIENENLPPSKVTSNENMEEMNLVSSQPLSPNKSLTIELSELTPILAKSYSV